MCTKLLLYNVWKSQKSLIYNIASEASYVYISSGQNWKLSVKQCYQTEQEIVENAKIEKFKWDIVGDFQTMWNRLANKENETFMVLFFLFWNSQPTRKVVANNMAFWMTP